MSESTLKTDFERFVIEQSRGTVAAPVGVWHNPSPRLHGFRLTVSAHLILVRAGVRSYTYNLLRSLRSQDLVDLDNYFTFPYYIDNYKKFVVYAEQDAVMLTLYGNDLRAYLDTLKTRYL